MAQALPKHLEKKWEQLKTAFPRAQDDPHWDLPQTPECGPIIGYARRAGNEIKLRLWVEPFLFSALDATGDTTNPSRFPIKQIFFPPIPSHPGTDPDDPGTTPEYPGTYWVYDVSVPGTFNQDLCISIEYLPNSKGINFKVEQVPQVKLATQDELKGVRIPLSRLAWFHHLRDQVTDRTAFLVGSCRYPGSPFDKELADRIFEPMLDHVNGFEGRPGVDHVLLVGDQIYADATADIFDTRELREHFTGRYRDAFSARNMRRLMSCVPIYMALDDHEFADNWPGNADTLNPMDPMVRDYMQNFYHGLTAVMAYQWSMSQQDGLKGCAWPPRDDDSGLWHTFESGRLPFFVMDTRTERKLRTAQIRPQDASIVGQRQLCELKKWLLNAPKDRPKFIVSGSVLAPVARDVIQRESLWRNVDGWAGYPATWRELVRYIVDNEIQKVVFIAGDYHISALSHLILRSKNKSVEAYQIVASAFFAPLPFANAQPRDYDWYDETLRPIQMPFSDDIATIEVEQYLLCTKSSHFVRVDVQQTQESNWSINVRVCDRTGVIRPSMEKVNNPFVLRANDAVEWNL